MRSVIDPAKEERLKRIAILGAMSFFLAAIEYAVPKPLPYLRLGIANLPLLLATGMLPFGDYLLLALVKWAGMGFVSGTLFSFVSMLSFSGTMAAALAMFAFARFAGRRSSFVAPGILGAFSSNVAQLSIAAVAVFGRGTALVAPPFLVMGLATGTALGLFANLFARTSRWYAENSPGGDPIENGKRATPKAESSVDPDRIGADDGNNISTTTSSRAAERAAGRSRKREHRAELWERALDPEWLALSGLGASFLLAFHPSFPVKLSLCLLFLALAVLSGRRIRILPSAITTLSIVAFNLAVPAGRVLASLGPVAITETSLFEGLERALVFEGLLFASLATIRPGLKLPGAFGRIISSSLSAYPLLLSSGASRRMRKAKGTAIHPEVGTRPGESPRARVSGKMAAVVALVDDALFSLAQNEALNETHIRLREQRGLSGKLLPIAMALLLAALSMIALPGV